MLQAEGRCRLLMTGSPGGSTGMAIDTVSNAIPVETPLAPVHTESAVALS